MVKRKKTKRKAARRMPAMSSDKKLGGLFILISILIGLANGTNNYTAILPMGLFIFGALIFFSKK